MDRHRQQARLQRNVSAQPETDPLAVTDERLRLAIEAASIGIFFIDLVAGDVLYSVELAEMLGFPGIRSTAVEAAFKRVHRDDLARVRALFEAAQDPDGEGRLRMELRFVRPGGEVRWMTWNGRVEFGEGPHGRRQAVSVIGACVDTTERREAEERVKESEARFRSLVELSSDWYWEQDENFRFIAFSEPVSDLAGSSPQSHYGKTRWELPTIGMGEADWAAHRTLLERHEPFRDLEYSRINERGEAIWMSVSGNPIFDAEGRFRGYRGTGHNITRRREDEQRIRESEQRLRLAGEAARIGFWEHDIASGTLRATPEFFHLFGLQPTTGAVTVKEIRSHYAPEMQARVARDVEASIKSGAPLVQDREILLPDGRSRWVSMRGDTRRDEDGVAIARFGAIMDVTPRKEAEIRLAESEQINRTTLQALPAHIAVIDADGRIMIVNDAWNEFAAENAVGGHPSVSVGASYLEVCRYAARGDSYAAEALAGIEAVITGHEPQFVMEYPCHSPTELRWFLMTVVPLRLGGERSGAVVSHVSITKRKLAETAVRESEERFRLLADSAPVLIWVAGPEGGEYFNRSYLSFVGARSEAELAGLSWADYLHPEDRGEYIRAFLAAERERAVFEAQARFRRADGAYRWMKSIGVPRLGADGAYLGYVGSTLDVTDLKSNEERVGLLVRELDHRVKNILARVQVVIDRTADKPLSTGTYVDALRSRIEAMTRAHELLSRARWTGASLERAVAVQLEAYATSSNVMLVGPELMLKPDAAQALSIVINELATNAAKYGALSTPAGRVDVSWRVVEAAGRVATLELVWRETAGPPVVAPTRCGYGTSVIRDLLAHELDAEVDLRYDGAGVVCRILVPVVEIVAAS